MRLRAVLVAALSLVASRAAAADEPSSVELVVSAPEVSTRVESWFAGRVPVTRVPAETLTTLPGSTDHAGVRVWIALEDPTTAHILFAVQRQPSQTPRYLVSDVPIDGGLDELGIERLGQIVYLSAMALWEGSVESSTEEVVQWLRRGQSEPPPPSPPPPASPSPPPRERTPKKTARWAPRLGAEYGATMSGDEGIAQTLGANVAALRETESSAIGVRARAALLVPREISTSGVTIDLRGFGVGFGATVDRRIGAHASIPAELGFRVDVVRYRTASFADPSYRAESGATDVRPTVYLRGGIRYDVGGVGVGLAANLDTGLIRTHYDLSDNGRRNAVVTPWLVRPGLIAGVTW